MYLLAYKVLYFCLIFVCIKLLPSQYLVEDWAENMHMHVLPDGYARDFETWDAQPYLWISQEGYGANPMLPAFYPLWPLLIHIGSWLIGGRVLVAALILANALSVAALV